MLKVPTSEVISSFSSRFSTLRTWKASIDPSQSNTATASHASRLIFALACGIGKAE